MSDNGCKHERSSCVPRVEFPLVETMSTVPCLPLKVPAPLKGHGEENLILVPQILQRAETLVFVFGGFGRRIGSSPLLFLMAIGFFSLSVFLFLGMDFDNGSPAPAYSTLSSEGVEVTYGSVLKLMHEKTRFRLQSHDVPYGSGSGQQSVTGFPGLAATEDSQKLTPEIIGWHSGVLSETVLDSLITSEMKV